MSDRKNNSKLNVLLIMADQFRADWLGCAGANHVETPNLDRLAQSGIRFPQAVCNSPLCAPSRAALAAGVYPHRLGVLDTTRMYPADYPTYYQALRQAGYRVGAVGKTDLHKPLHYYGRNGDTPLMYHLGFTDIEDTEGKINAAQFGRVEFGGGDGDGELVGPYQHYLRARGTLDSFVDDYKSRRGKPTWYSAKSALIPEDYHDSYIGARACRFLSTVSDESPWHYFVSFVGPHDPWDAPEAHYNHYADRSFPPSIEDDLADKPKWIQEKSKKMSANMRSEDLDEVKRHYAGMISNIDDWIGRIMQVLEGRGLLDDTVIIFCSDHGEMMGDHGLFLKSVMYESALRVPLIIRHPGAVWQGEHDGLAELVDLAPTILEFAGVETNSRMDGQSLSPLLWDKTLKHKDRQISELYNTRMIFDGRYKFIEHFNDTNELYDIEADPRELNNLIRQEPQEAQRLLMELRMLTQ